MLGHVYVVEDARDLAQIVRDVTRYGGAYRPEVRPRLESAVSFELTPASLIPVSKIRMYTNSFNAAQSGRRLRRRSIRLCII